MKTYTVATLNGMIIATVPDDRDIDAAVTIEAENARCDFQGYETQSGLTLTDSLDEGEDWELKSGMEGRLIDETGKDWAYAVLRGRA